MKIIIISEYNIFTSVGGTEYYVDMLLEGLAAKQNEVVLITQGKHETGIEIKVNADAPVSFKTILLSSRYYTVGEIRQQEVSSTWAEMLPILLKEGPQVIHVHTYSTFFNIRHFEECRNHFKTIFFTSHIPGHFCPKGDLIQFNRKPCDGKIYVRCAGCLFTKSIKEGVSNLFHQYHHKVLERLLLINDLGVRMICVAEWQKENAIRNGFNNRQLSVIRQAVSMNAVQKPKNNPPRNVFTIGYLGRLAHEKGAQFLLNIIPEILKHTNFNIVLGIPLTNSDPDSIQAINKLALIYPDRLLIMDDIRAHNKSIFFNAMDCLLIPSFCIETGPVVLLETLQYHKRVLCPNVGGPIEFKQEFPDSVSTYTWNNIEDALAALTTIGEESATPVNHDEHLKAMEHAFIQQHELLYANAVFHQTSFA